MKEYKCVACSYIYEEEIGDPMNNIEAGTRFEDIPGDWECPLCGAAKEYFQEI